LQHPAGPGKQQTELHDVGAVIANLARAVERAPDLDPLIEQMRERQQQRGQLQQAIASAETLRQVQLDRAAIEADVQACVANWRATLATEALEGGRELLREVLTGPLMFTPTETGYTFRGPVVLGELIAGAVNEEVQAAGAQLVASPRGARVTFDPKHEEAYELALSGTVRRAA
jgi:hypothetical protein